MMKVKDLIKFLQTECDPEREVWGFDSYTDLPCPISEIVKVKNFKKEMTEYILKLGMNEEDTESVLEFFNDELDELHGNDIILK